MIYHNKWIVRLLMLLWFTTPYFLPALYGIVFQLFYVQLYNKIASVKSFHIRNITRFNMRTVMNSLIWPVLITIYLNYEYQGYDWLNLLLLLTIIAVKLCQNYVLCTLEGERVVVNLSTNSKTK